MLHVLLGPALTFLALSWCMLLRARWWLDMTFLRLGRCVFLRALLPLGLDSTFLALSWCMLLRARWWLDMTFLRLSRCVLLWALLPWGLDSTFLGFGRGIRRPMITGLRRLVGFFLARLIVLRLQLTRLREKFGRPRRRLCRPAD